MYFFIFMFVGIKSWSTLIMDSPVFLPLRYYSSSLIMVLFYILVLICVSCGMLWTCWLYPVPSLLSAWTCCKLGLLLFISVGSEPKLGSAWLWLELLGKKAWLSLAHHAFQKALLGSALLCSPYLAKKVQFSSACSII